MKRSKVTAKTKEQMFQAFMAAGDNDVLYDHYKEEIVEEDDIESFLFDKWFDEYYTVEK